MHTISRTRKTHANGHHARKSTPKLKKRIERMYTSSIKAAKKHPYKMSAGIISAGVAIGALLLYRFIK